MPFDLSLPIYAVSAAAAIALVALLRRLGWPHIRLRTYNQLHGGLRVVEVALILSGAASARRPAASRAGRHPAAAEFVIYMTLKTGNL
jgi:hypothetical protein